MRSCCSAIGFLVACSAVPAQTPAPETPQFRKLIALSKSIAIDVEKRDGSLNNATVLTYIQILTDRLAVAANVKPLQVHVTRGQAPYAMPLTTGELYISASLLESIENEAELAGLLAHELAHPTPLQSTPVGTIELYRPSCILSSNKSLLIPRADHREEELTATRTGLQTLRTAGYEPTALLDLFSKLSYNNPGWAKAIAADDLLDLRAREEATDPPAVGYILNSSAFDEHHFQIQRAVGHTPQQRTPPSLIKSGLRPTQ